MTEYLSSQAGELRHVARTLDRDVLIMEVCGTHTVSIFRHGLRALLPPNVRLVSGPGCPVCVTAQRHIDAAIRLSAVEEIIIATYGDMVRVPGELGSLEHRQAEGADVRVVGSALSALRLAERFPNRPTVFIAVGFETTAPATAAAILRAKQRGINNFFILAAHKLVVPAMTALLEGGDARINGFLCPGHVSVIIGSEAYRAVAERFRVPCVVAGFEPNDILRALTSLLCQMRDGEALVENDYKTAVSSDGNRVARRMMDQVFETADTPWRALGVIPNSGLALRAGYRRFDALARFDVALGDDLDHRECLCGSVIQGKASPDECRLFGTVCTPLTPLGPCMVSSEGTCSAWYKYSPKAIRCAKGTARTHLIAGG